MKIDYRNNRGPNEDRLVGGKCLVDGKEVKLVFFADNVNGIVISYDTGDGKIHTSVDAPEIFPGGLPVDIEAPRGGVMTRTLAGKVELIDKDGVVME